MSNSSTAKFTSIALKTVGAILIISSLIDYITLAIPFQPLDSQWQITFTSQVVDRGIVPMVGIAFMMVGYWVENSASRATASGFSFKLPVFILSLFMGLVFLILVPLYLNNLRLVSTDVLGQIEQEAGVQETRISEQYEQLNTISADPERLQLLESRIRELDQAIGSGQLQGRTLNAQQLQQLQANRQQLQSVRELAQNPEELEIKKSELQTQLLNQKKEREGRARTETIKRGVRTGFSSFLLAIGYLVMGWFGLQGTKNDGQQPRSSQASVSR